MPFDLGPILMFVLCFLWCSLFLLFFLQWLHASHFDSPRSAVILSSAPLFDTFALVALRSLSKALSSFMDIIWGPGSLLPLLALGITADWALSLGGAMAFAGFIPAITTRVVVTGDFSEPEAQSQLKRQPSTSNRSRQNSIIVAAPSTPTSSTMKSISWEEDQTHGATATPATSSSSTSTTSSSMIPSTFVPDKDHPRQMQRCKDKVVEELSFLLPLLLPVIHDHSLENLPYVRAASALLATFSLNKVKRKWRKRKISDLSFGPAAFCVCVCSC